MSVKYRKVRGGEGLDSGVSRTQYRQYIHQLWRVQQLMFHCASNCQSWPWLSDVKLCIWCSPIFQLTSCDDDQRVKLHSLWRWLHVPGVETSCWGLYFWWLYSSLLYFVTYCGVTFYFEILCLMYLVDWRFRGFDPWAILEVDSVSGEILNVIGFTILADLDHLTKTFYS